MYVCVCVYVCMYVCMYICVHVFVLCMYCDEYKLLVSLQQDGTG